MTHKEAVALQRNCDGKKKKLASGKRRRRVKASMDSRWWLSSSWGWCMWRLWSTNTTQQHSSPRLQAHGDGNLTESPNRGLIRSMLSWLMAAGQSH